MFDAIAGRYDLMNRVMTLGQDQGWRRFVDEKEQLQANGRLLDLASGTGDIAALAKFSTPQALIIGADFSQNMLREARRRFADSTISWHVCDANYLPYADQSFDAVTFGYLLRNVDDSLVVLREVYRVLKPGGRVVCLDSTPPRKNILYPMLQIYFKVGIPVLGKLLAQDKSAYAYLTGSTMNFHTAEKLAELFSTAGFAKVGFKRFMFGTIGVHWGMK